MTARLFCCGFAFALTAAHAQPAPREDAFRTLTGTCTTCHGTQGRSGEGMPSLAGLERGYLVEQMRRFRDGTRPATIMHQIARGYSDEQAERLADYFARQTPAR